MKDVFGDRSVAERNGSSPSLMSEAWRTRLLPMVRCSEQNCIVHELGYVLPSRIHGFGMMVRRDGM